VAPAEATDAAVAAASMAAKRSVERRMVMALSFPQPPAGVVRPPDDLDVILCEDPNVLGWPKVRVTERKGDVTMWVPGTVLAVLCGAVLIAGCGDDEQETEAPAATQTAQTALAEIEKVRTGLDEAQATYASGDAAAADTQVGDTYLEHFELVEGPLGDKDAELNEKLEDTIREELREKITAKAPKGEVAALFDEIDADLDKAEAALR
jgi:outer membrane murein-binding lipoprotein Lpp